VQVKGVIVDAAWLLTWRRNVVGLLMVERYMQPLSVPCMRVYVWLYSYMGWS